MKDKSMSRRTFINKTSMSIAGTAIAGGMSIPTFAKSIKSSKEPAILGGSVIHKNEWPKWPIWNPKTDEKKIIKVLQSGVWSRNKVVAEFENKWADILGAKRSILTTNGTHALITSLKMLGIGPGDEVLTTPYTFIATIDAILLSNAMPVFVDVDPETYQIDPSKIEEKITSKTKAILPVHILGLPADMGKIMEIARKHDLKVIEDACQAHLAEINGKKVGTFGHAGCFSFQNSKNLAIGEGGAIVSDDDDFMDHAFSFHNFGRPYGNMVGDVSGQYVMVGTKCRSTEYQAAIGLVQLSRLEEQTELRNQNAEYLKSQIQSLPGIIPYNLYKDVTRATYHLFPFTYKTEQFQDLPRDKFLKSLKAEGIPCSGGYTPLNTMPYLKDALSSKVFQAVYSKEELDFDNYVEKNKCPVNDQMCEEMVWLPQNVLLGTKKDMDDIAEAISKIHKYASEIKSKL
ncbi:MAG: DegT/DnrJ/EryC1/StrS family aminotransferase [Bacteroidota bacterium]